MLKFDERLYEILLICDGSGKIKKVLYNSLKLDIFPIIGQSIIKFTDESSKISLINTFYKAIDFHQSSQCEINIKLGKSLYLMGIAAKRLDTETLIVGMVSTTNTINMYEDLMKINNESINELRNLAKEQASINKNQNYLTELGMSNYLEVVNSNRENKRDFVEVLNNTIDIANFFGAYKNVKIKCVYNNLELCISHDLDLIYEILNSLMSCIIKHAANNSNVQLCIDEYQEATILEIEFRQANIKYNILKDSNYKVVQETIENYQGMIWYEEEQDFIKFYVLEPIFKSVLY